MALVTLLERIERNIRGVHTPVSCSWDQFKGRDNRTYLQLVTYGSDDREMRGEVSQTIQFDEAAAMQLKNIIEQVFRLVKA
jgi:hypothetical protein